MTEIGYTLLKELAVLGAGRQPIIQPQGTWVFQTANGMPTLAADGIATDGARVAWVGVRAAQTSGRARAHFRIDGYDAATTYDATMTRGATSETESSVADGSAAAALAALGADFVTSLAAYNPTVEVVASPHDILTVETDLPFSQTAVDTGGTGKLYCVGDARAFAYRIWGLPLWATDPSDAPVWQPIEDGLVRIGSWPVHRCLIDCAGYSRIYVETLGSDGLYVPFVGPCVAEATADDLSNPLASADAAWATIHSERLEIVDEVSTFGGANTTKSFSGTGTLGVDLPLPFVGMTYPINLPQFDLLVKNTGATVIMVSNEEPNASNPDPISQVPVAQTLVLGPLDKLLHPVTLYDSAAGAVAGDVRFMWR